MIKHLIHVTNCGKHGGHRSTKNMKFSWKKTLTQSIYVDIYPKPCTSDLHLDNSLCFEVLDSSIDERKRELGLTE